VLPFGIQLYSVRDHLAKDAPATLAALKEAGYDAVELFDVKPKEAKAWRKMLDKAGLKAAAAHVNFDAVTKRTKKVAKMARILKFEDIVVPWLKLDGRDAWREAAEQMDEAGAVLRSEGLRLGYHNHDHEFQRFRNAEDGAPQTPFDLIFGAASPENLFLELDVRWASELGADPVELIRRFGDRCRLLHVKDRPREGSVPFCEVGTGTINWRPIFTAARLADVRWYFVEQDESATDSLESAAISAAFMQTQ
jgi:sugar phosphate isomerase/epimerase